MENNFHNAAVIFFSVYFLINWILCKRFLDSRRYAFILSAVAPLLIVGCFYFMFKWVIAVILILEFLTLAAVESKSERFIMEYVMGDGGLLSGGIHVMVLVVKIIFVTVIAYPVFSHF